MFLLLLKIIQGLHADMQRREAQLREELQSKEAENSRLREELKTRQGLPQEGAKVSQYRCDREKGESTHDYVDIFLHLM